MIAINIAAVAGSDRFSGIQVRYVKYGGVNPTAL